MPDRLINAGEFAALLVMVTLSVTLPIAAGAKVTVKVAVCPGPRMSPLDRPLILKPAPEPEKVTLEVVILALPELVNVTLWLLVVPILTLPKLKVDALAVSCPGTALTVRVAALLITLPAELLTVIENCEPLSAAVVIGVV